MIKPELTISIITFFKKLKNLKKINFLLIRVKKGYCEFDLKKRFNMGRFIYQNVQYQQYKKLLSNIISFDLI